MVVDNCCNCLLCNSLAVESPQPSALRTKPAADEVPKKKDGRGRPRKDRTMELAKSSGTPVSTAVVCTVSPFTLVMSSFLSREENYLQSFIKPQINCI